MLWGNKHLLLTGHTHLDFLATIRYTLEYILPLALFDATICNIKVYSVFPKKRGGGADMKVFHRFWCRCLYHVKFFCRKRGGGATVSQHHHCYMRRQIHHHNLSMSMYVKLAFSLIDSLAYLPGYSFSFIYLTPFQQKRVCIGLSRLHWRTYYV